MKKWIFLIALLSSTVYADDANLKCPNVALIKAVGLSDNLARDQNGHWYAGRTKQHYGTSVFWTFVIGDIRAPNKQKALHEAKEALATLSFKSGPTPAPSNKLLCLYDNDEGFPSGALTPPISQLSELGMDL